MHSRLEEFVFEELLLLHPRAAASRFQFSYVKSVLGRSEATPDSRPIARTSGLVGYCSWQIHSKYE